MKMARSMHARAFMLMALSLGLLLQQASGGGCNRGRWLLQGSTDVSGTGTSTSTDTAKTQEGTTGKETAGGANQAASDASSGPASPPPTPSGEPVGMWRRAQTSWYGTPEPFVEPFTASRGGGKAAFGILEWGGCGYTNGDGTMAVSKDMVTAYSDSNPDSPGACGRCYEVKCSPGPVIGTGDKPVGLEHWYYFPKFANVSDDQGRYFPGNPTEADNYISVQCWDPNKTLVVKVIDICPCWYCPTGPDGKAMGCRYQEGCCNKKINHPKAGQHSFDLSFWAFEQLAHPEYGVMMIDFRPVDCYSHQPLQFIPGFISHTLYKDMVGEGWAWFAYKTPPANKNNFNVTASGQGVDGSNAACAEIENGGAMTFWCRGCGVPNFEPFPGVASISLWVKDRLNPGSTPPVKVVLSGDTTDASMDPNQKIERVFCNSEVYLNTRSPSNTAAGGWQQFVIPMSDFNCPKDNIPKLNKIDLMTLGYTEFCVDNAELQSGAPTSN